MNILGIAKSLESEVIRIRRELHKFPECGLILPKTSEFIKNYLHELNVEFKTYEKHSGIVALIGKSTGVKTVALRADMDGLMIKEETELDFSSENENMHACGHDGHTAILLVVAKILKEHEEEFNGKIKLIFQPGEEGPGGALPMVEDGVLEDPKVDAIFALHLGNIGSSVTEGIEVKSGDVIVSRSNMFAADDQFYIKISGKGGHGSAPDLSIDPVAISIQVMNSLQYIVSREIKPSNPAVITISSITAGRDYYNIIPDCAEIRGTIRCLNYETRDFIFNRMKEIVHGVTKSMRGDSEIDFRDGYPPLINSGEVVFNIIVPSGSGQAAITMPIMAPLADVIGLTRQTAVLAYQFGDAFTNVLTPTSGYFMAALAMSKISWNKWAKWFLPLFSMWCLIAAIFLIVAVQIGYGPF